MAGGFSGLGAVMGGYEQGAQDYWRRRELESTSAYGAGLRELLLSEATSGTLPGAAPGPAALPGGQMAPMAPLSAPMPLAPGAGAGGPPPAIPAGAGPPAMTAGPPGGFVNPLMVNRQPQNLTGGGPGPNGIIPPGGTGGAPPGGPAAPSPAPQPAARPGAPMMPMGGMRPQASWMDIGKAILKANPNISDDQLAFAINKSIPIMNVQSQAEWKNVEMLLAMERNDLLRAQIGSREGIAARREEGLMTRAQLGAEIKTMQEQGRMARAQLSSNTKIALENARDDVKRELAELSEAGKDERLQMTDATRRWIASQSMDVKREIAKALEEGRTLRMEEVQGRIDTRQQRSIAAQGERQQTGIAAQGARQDKAIAAAGMRQDKAITARQAPLVQGARNAIVQLDDAIADIEDAQAGGTAVTGVQGWANRWREWGNQFVDSDDAQSPTRATVFENRIRTLQLEVPRLLAGVGRIAADERAKIDTVVRGLGTFTSAQQAKNGLNYLRKVLEDKVPRDMGVGPSRQTDGPPPAGGRSRPTAGRQSQQPADAPPISMLREGYERDFEYPDGSHHTWKLINGQPTEVLDPGLPEIPGNLRPGARGGGAGAAPF